MKWSPAMRIPGGPFTLEEQTAIAAIRDGKSPPKSEVCETLEARGIVKVNITQEYIPFGRRKYSEVKSYDLDQAAIAALTKPLAVWLPNALIDGAADEVSPVELLRQTRGLPALRLLIELYAVQFLPNYGGVPRELLQVVFDRAKIGEQGPFVVWAFKPKHTEASRDLAGQFLTGQFTKRPDGKRHDAGWDVSFWPAVNTLTELGLVELVGMVLDGGDAEAEIIHPYAARGGEPAERALAKAAFSAAGTMVTAGQLDGAEAWAEGSGPNLVPVRRHITNAAMVEIFRLKYRPHTTATAAWYALMQQTTAEYLNHYKAMTKDGAAATSAA